MTLDQKSLREYTLTNNSLETIIITYYKFINGEWVKGNYGTFNNDDYTLSLGVGEEITIFLTNDGIYKLTSDTDYVIHNITDILKIRQEYLTKALMEYNVDKCDHNSYINYVTFCLIFDSYIDLVEDTFRTGFAVNSIVPTTVLYKIDYLYNQLLKYKP